MKRMRVLAAGVCLLLLLVVPVMAVAADQDLSTRGSDTAAGGMADSIGGSGSAPVSRGGSCGLDLQSPLLPGAVFFREYDTFFVHGMNAVPDLPDTDVEAIDRYGEGLDIILVGTNSSLYPDAVIYCPMPGYERKTGGIQPVVRYIAVQYASGISGSFYPEVYKVEVFNGCSSVKTLNAPFSNNGSCSVQILDLGGWYAFNRGLNIVLHIRNGAPAAEGFFITGYGARFEW